VSSFLYKYLRCPVRAECDSFRLPKQVAIYIPILTPAIMCVSQHTVIEMIEYRVTVQCDIVGIYYYYCTVMS